ncbi:MAG: Spy/CpxP family protein refolding chaperone [Gammaproteobacteria bacterium]|jgi:Spy/CpxP family protein refolding chaperone
MMNPPYIKRALTLISIMMLFSTGLIADSIPNPAAAQKTAIDHMHHKLHDDQSPFKAKEAQALKELNEMTIREGVGIEDMNAKINELMAAKTQIMRLRYGHLVEMRTVLTEEQKVGYDNGVLNRSAVK